MNRFGLRRRLASLLTAAALLAAAACGSTVPGGGTTAAGEQGTASDDGFTVPGEESGEAGTFGSGDGDGTSAGGDGGQSTSGGRTSSGTPSGGGSGRPSSGAAAPGSAGGTGPGVTDTEIFLGIPYCNDCSSANAALGAGSEDPGDTRRYFQAALDDVNARGGVLGRTIVPVFHEVSAADNIEVSQQEACEAFTSDNKVLMIFFRGEISYECGKKAGILVMGGGATGPVYDKYQNMFSPAGIRLERLFDVTVKAMVKAGWHEPDTTWPTGRIGLVTWDNPDYRYAMENGYLKGLREAGLEATDVRYVAVPQSADSIADASASISSAVLSFQSRGVDHVFIGDGSAGIFAGAGLTFLFLSNAKSQNYFPRYGFNTNNAPDFDSHPKDQLVGMLAIDSADSEPANDEGIELNPVRERCFEVMRNAGLPVGQWQTQGIAVGACEIAWFSEAVIGRATRGTTLPGMIAAGESLGTSYRSPASYGNRIGPGQHDGAALFRMLQWGPECECIEYTSKPFEP